MSKTVALGDSTRRVKEQWAQLTPYERDAWIAKELYGWSVTKEPPWFDHGQYWGNPTGKVNKRGGLAGIGMVPVPRYTTIQTEDYWIRELEKKAKQVSEGDSTRREEEQL